MLYKKIVYTPDATLNDSAKEFASAKLINNGQDEEKLIIAFPRPLTEVQLAVWVAELQTIDGVGAIIIDTTHISVSIYSEYAYFDMHNDWFDIVSWMI